MIGLQIVFCDGVPAHVAEIRILDTYAGQLSGTLTVGTKYRLASIEKKMKDLIRRKSKGYYYLEPELVDEATLRGLPDCQIKKLRKRTELGLCMKEHHLIATLHVADKDYCNIIEVHWFQTSKELAEKPLAELIQNAAWQLSFEKICVFCDREDWLDMY